MAPTLGPDGIQNPQSATDLREEGRLQAIIEALKICQALRVILVDRLLTLEDKILETSAFEDALSTNINESSELIATMCDILESEPNTTDSNSDLVLTLMDDISAEELSRERIMKHKNCFATQIFRYNNDHTTILSALSELDIDIRELEENFCFLSSSL